MTGDRNHRWRPLLLAAIAVSLVVGAMLADPIAQDVAYYDFADRRPVLGVPNGLDVLSNLPFLIIGVWGMRAARQSRLQTALDSRTAWQVFFFGIAVIAVGSGYFHWSPSTATLVWDRLPMTIGFMSLVSIIVAEYFSVRWARRLLLPLLIAGAASVFWWWVSEAQGHGDLRPYALVQFLPMSLIPLVLLLYRGRSVLARYLWWMIAFYVLAKLTEHFDKQIFAVGTIVSGHTLKHLFAALAPASLLIALLQRRER